MFRGFATLLLTAAFALAGPAIAQDWPGKPVRLVVNFPPGGAADVLARALGAQLSESLKQQFVIDNRPGANGNIGADAVAKAPADGYTLLMSSGGPVSINQHLYAKMPFDPEKDLAPVASVALVRVYLITHPSVPATTVTEFVAHLKANPGKLSYGSAGTGSSPHIAGEMLQRAAQVNATHVPYKGAAPALADLLGGQVQYMFDPGPGLRYTKEGKLRLLAVASSKRAAQFPDTPTLAELGMPSVDADTVFGIYAPAGTPTPIVTRLHDEINRVLKTPKMAEVAAALGAEVAISTMPEFIDRQGRDRARYGAFIREAGIKAE
ncbi:MAG TPA: tripartite tricarboxylate transporter substrate binding protein [Casimicrobiaceae bacterium]|nr:tripartite tricarboxylate transporter substrate binding protein [Casimicrobiaceae bacterium]